MPSLFSICFTYFYSFIWLHQVLVVACRIFSGGMWDQVPWSRIERRPPILGAQSLSHWTTMEVSSLYVLNKAMCPLRIPSCNPKVHLVNPEPHWGEKQWDWKHDLIPPGSTSPPARITQNDVRMKSALGSWMTCFLFFPFSSMPSYFPKNSKEFLQWGLAYVHSTDRSSPADTYRGNTFVRNSYTFSLLIFILYWNIVD